MHFRVDKTLNCPDRGFLDPLVVLYLCLIRSLSRSAQLLLISGLSVSVKFLITLEKCRDHSSIIHLDTFSS